MPSWHGLGQFYIFLFHCHYNISFSLFFFFCLNRTQESEKLHHLLLSVLQSLKQLRADVMNEDKLRQLGNFDLYSQMIYCFVTRLS